MEPAGNLRDAMFQAGRLGHVEAVKNEDQVSYQVRKGFGNWLTHVVKWYSNKGYKERITQQRSDVLNNLNQLCGTLNPPGTQGTPFSDQRVEKLRTHLAHGQRFQAQSMRILADFVIQDPVVEGNNCTVAKKLIARQFKTDDAALKNLRIPGTENDIGPHHDVNKEKFGAAYWQHVNATVSKISKRDLPQDALDKNENLNAGMALLQYVLSKEENENYAETELLQVKPVQRNNDLGIDFEDWGIPEGIDNIELRLIHGFPSLEFAQSTVNLGAEGREALVKDREGKERVLRITQNPYVRKLHMLTLGKQAQLARLYEQFMQDEEMGGSTAPP